MKLTGKRIVATCICVAMMISSFATTALATNGEETKLTKAEYFSNQTVERNFANSDEVTSASKWITVKGISGGKIAFDASKGAITSCQDTVTTVTIPSKINGVTVKTIGEDAFKLCIKIKKISIPSTITSIGDDAFMWCDELENITVAKSNSKFSSIDGVLFNKDKSTLIKYPANKAGKTYSIPTSVKTLGKVSFGSCEYLTDIKIPNSVKTIEDKAIHQCEKITEITIPESVTAIGYSPFQVCTSLKNIVVDENNTKFCSEDGVLFDYNKTKLIQYPLDKADEVYTVPYTVEILGVCSFASSQNLKKVIVGDSVKELLSEVFTMCINLEEVTLGNSVETIGRYAFALCGKLTKVKIPNSVTKIEKDSFTASVNIELEIDHRNRYATDFALENHIHYYLVIIKESSYGDVNLDGKVSINDTVEMMMYLAKKEEFTEEQLKNADVTAYGVNIQDVIVTQTYIAKIINKFPIEDFYID